MKMSIYENKDRYIDEYEGRNVIYVEKLIGEQRALEEVKRISIRLKEEGKSRRNLSASLRKSAILPESAFNLDQDSIKKGKKYYNDNSNYNKEKIAEKKVFFDVNIVNKKTKNNSVKKRKIATTPSKIYSIANQGILENLPERVKYNKKNGTNIIKKNGLNSNIYHGKKENFRKIENNVLSSGPKKAAIREIIEEKDDEQEETEENLKNNKNVDHFNEIIKQNVKNKLHDNEFEEKIPVKDFGRFHCNLKGNNISSITTVNIETNKNNINNMKKNNLNSFLFSNQKKENSKEIDFLKKQENVENNFLRRNIKQNKRYDFHRNASEIHERYNKIENYKFKSIIQNVKKKQINNDEDNLRKSANPFTRKYNFFSNSTYKEPTEMQNKKSNLQKEKREEEVNQLSINKISSCKKRLSNSSIDKRNFNLRYRSVGSNKKESYRYESQERTKDKSNDIGNNKKKKEINYFKNINKLSEKYYDINEDNKTISDINFNRSSSREKSYEDKNKNDNQYLIKLIIRK